MGSIKLNLPGTCGLHVLVWLLISSSLWLGGCARLRPGVKPAEAVKRPDRLLIAEVSGVQHAYSVAPQKGYNTFEIYLENHGTNAIVFQSVSLNGRELSPVVEAQPATPRQSTGVTNEAPRVAASSQPLPTEVAWWQFYPSPELKTGETIVCQVNFRSALTAQRRLELCWGGSNAPGGKPQLERMEITVPRFRQPETLITAITFPTNYAKVFVQYHSRHVAPVKVWLNHRAVTNFTVLPSPEPDTPDMLAVAAPFKLTTGMPLHVKLQFASGVCRQALVRALNGVLLDAYALGGTVQGRELGLDLEPAVLNLKAADGGDVACYDVKKGTFGAAAALVIEDREQLFHKQQSKLAAIHFCTPVYPELWNVYGQISDAAYANPYRLGWGRNQGRFIEEEEDCIKKAWQSGRPRPFLWIPESFKSRQRFLEGTELEVLGWMALLRGAKGIKYINLQGNLDGYPAALVEAMKSLDQAVHEREAELSPLMLVSEHTISVTSGQGSAIKHRQSTIENRSSIRVYTSWAGDHGILVMVRNLDYRTDGQSNDEGRAPRFHATPKADLAIPVKLPDWFRFKGARDLLTEHSVPVQQAGGKVAILLERLDAFVLVWLENQGG